MARPRTQVAAIDGKTVRRLADRANGKSPIHVAGAWATANGVALGQVKTDDRSNEITAIQESRKTFEIKGCVVTIEGMGYRKNTARETVKQGADYVSAVMKNRTQLWEDIAGAFEYGEAALERGVFQDREQRTRARRAPTPLGDVRPVCDQTRERLGDWENMNGVAMTESTRWANGATTVHRRRFMAKLVLRKPAPQSRRTNARESSRSKPSVLRSAGVSI